MAVHIIVLVQCLQGHNQGRASSAVALGGNKNFENVNCYLLHSTNFK